MNRPARARWSASHSRMLSPLKRMSPFVTSYLGWPIRVFANVLLPEPFGPMIAWISPFSTVSDSPLRISLSSIETCRSLISSAGVWLMLPPSGRKAIPTRAAVPHVGVVELEAGTHQALDVVDLGTRQQHGALEVHVQTHSIGVQDFVARTLGVAELHEVGVARTAAPAHADPKTDVGRATLGEQLLHLLGRSRGEGDHGIDDSFPGFSISRSGTKSLRFERGFEPASGRAVMPVSSAGSATSWSRP